MKCPRCDEEVKLERNLAKHQKGQVCMGFVFERQMDAAGWRVISSQYQNIIKAAKVPWVKGPKMYIGGWTSRVLHVRRMLWVPASVAAIVERRSVGIMSFAGPIRLVSVPQLKEKLIEWRKSNTTSVPKPCPVQVPPCASKTRRG